MRRHLRPLLTLTLACAALAVLVLTVSPRPDAPTDDHRMVFSLRSADRASSTEIQVGDLVRVRRQPQPTCEKLADPAKGYSGVHLIVAGLDTGVSALSCDDGVDPTMTFELRRVKREGGAAPPQTEQAAWDLILGHPLLEHGRLRVLDVDAGQADKAGSSLALRGVQLHLRIFCWWAPLAAIAVLFVWALTLYLGAHSALVRNPAPAGTPLEQRTFSLARTQFAWWFSIIFASLVFLWLVTGELPALSSQALALLGISGATTALSNAVAPGRLANDGREGVFLQELLSDADGVAIHRFQMVVMTVAMGLAFLHQVLTRLTMPEFDPSLLTMVGLSSAAYVGLKIPEASTPTPPADPKAGYTPADASVLPAPTKTP